MKARHESHASRDDLWFAPRSVEKPVNSVDEIAWDRVK
jgi:hypothetical protein